jgi:LemA protein
MLFATIFRNAQEGKAMSVAGFVFFGVSLVLLLYAVVIYNRQVSLKHDTAKA